MIPCQGGSRIFFNRGGSHHSLTVSYLIEILIEGVATPTTLLEPVPSCYVYDRDLLVSGHQGILSLALPELQNALHGGAV